MRYTIIVTIIVFSISFANSQSKVKINCDSAETQREMNICAEQSFKDADKELNAVYKQLMQALRSSNDDSDSQAALYNKNLINSVIQAQKKWLEYRDSFANVWKAKYDGGSMMPLVYFGSLTSLTKSQTKELKDLLNDVNQ